jgi:LuxR family transcriptional regulator, maltose regulon positive regulatory protein
MTSLTSPAPERAGQAGHNGVRPGGAGLSQPQGLLQGKLEIPSPSFPVLHRHRVTMLLEEASRHRVTLVAGPAGSGKTVACSSWAASGPAAGRVAWISVEAADRRDWFWAYVCSALTRLRPGPAEVMRALADSPSERFPLRLVEAAQSFSRPVILVLDDVHELADERVLSGLDVLVRHAPSALRLMLIARRPPGLQLARLRVAGELADVGTAELACTQDEADSYFAMLGMDVSADQRDEVLRRTEGWMAGLRLAAMKAQGSTGDSEITDLAGNEPLVNDYLWDEVLARQEPETRAFLTRTAVVADLGDGELCGGLADAVCGQSGSARTLERLSRDNNFVVATSGDGGGYRYHPLLTEVLTAELQREFPQEVPALLRRAARWFAAHGRLLDSVRSAVKAQDWDSASHALAQSGVAVVMSAGPAKLESVLALLPAERAAEDPVVACAWASARLWAGDAEGAAAYLDSATRALSQATPAQRRVAEPTALALRIMQAGGSAATEGGWALATSLQASASSRAEHRAAGLLWFVLGMASLRRYEAGPAARALRYADRQLGAGGHTSLRARVRVWRAFADACCGELTAAQQAADDVRKGAIPATREASFLAVLAYAQVALARDDLVAAQQLLAEADQARMGYVPGEPSLAALVSLVRAKALLADGDAAAARSVLSRLRDQPGADVGLGVRIMEAEAALRAGDNGRARALLLLDGAEGASRPDVTLIEAGLLLAEGGFAEALDAVGPCLDGVVAATRLEQIGAHLVAAVAERRLGQSEAAAGLLERAFALAEPEGAYRVFLDAGTAVRSAVTVLIPPMSRYAGFAGRILERFDSMGPRLAAPAGNAQVQLTDSERAVLCFLPSHMTNEEISQALFLSVNTVKTHLRSAYRKLGVGSRREAIARGRRLGLLLVSPPGRGLAGPWLAGPWVSRAVG